MSQRPSIAPLHSVSACPICGGGLCGIRVCGLPTSNAAENHQPSSLHGLVVCDECEAIWQEPDTSTPHVYPNSEDARCPVCDESLWHGKSRWAGLQDIALLEWSAAVDPKLDLRDSDDDQTVA